ncbi:MAG: pimeloyl-ACP methyl ester carboxylesterase [Myxococcota bacterium]|jgi:pimeloyl-ACP methyl ester carboxylesterase
MDFLPAYVEVGAKPAQAPQRSVLLLHGILGSASNWRGFSRRLAAEYPAWRFLVVDLRNHGDSVGAPGPHTVEACAQDLARLTTALGLQAEFVIGHSFGGKVALTYAAQPTAGVAEVWLLDAPPGALDASRPGAQEIERVIDTIRTVETPLETRAALVQALTERGLSNVIAQWMTTNLRRTNAGYVWRFSLPGIVEMMQDYAQLDLWPTLRGLPASTTAHVVRGGRSDRWAIADLVALEEVGAAPNVVVHTLAKAGHWVHVDDAAGLSTLLGAALSRLASS